ncbi:DNA-binding protein [Pseudoduganella sp. SL102]|uniref:PPC domain-containing DNA-binding protein n=1 Tax=Pseudoduganella sp. SL102 TaxID=2995154 RepID=UPI00248CBD2A|nr:PPC domain-containing DNA-binding protein [Pseudoduganella sp. SL102]WBS05835.1 DNA-binding protein [Pseudoduganella sp. SL102]
MHAQPLRLGPGDDVRGAIEALLRPHGAAFVLQGIGSLSVARLRFAGRPQADELVGDIEILTLAGSVSPDGAHLHMTIADADGQVLGGHVAPGCTVRTTVELLAAVLPAHVFGRKVDPATGYPELVVRSAGDEPSIPG